VQHTSASLTINENYDSDVQADTETFLNRIVPEVCGPKFFSYFEGYRSNGSSFFLIIFRAAVLLGSTLWKVSYASTMLFCLHDVLRLVCKNCITLLFYETVRCLF
jgi:hypothetical protein